MANVVCLVEAPPTCHGCDTVQVDGKAMKVERQPLFTSADIIDIEKTIDPINGMPALIFRFKPDSSRRIKFLTLRYIEDRIGEYQYDPRQVPLMVGSRVISNAALMEPFGESMVISGLPHTEIDAYFALLTQPSGTPPASQ